MPRSSHPQQLSFDDLEAMLATPTDASTPVEETDTDGVLPPGAAEETARVVPEGELPGARAMPDDRSPLHLLAACLAQLGAPPLARPLLTDASLRQARDDWLRRLKASCRSESALVAYRIAIDDLLAWAGERSRNLFEEATIVDYLAFYQQRAQPAPATYYRRFGLLRRFFGWLSRRAGMPDPFLELAPPPKPQQEADWLTTEEFERLLAGAAAPRRRRQGLVERDRLVLLALLQTGLRRSELIALNWCDLDLEGDSPSLLVRRGKGGKPRRQPLAPALAHELARLSEVSRPSPDAAVFCGLEGKRLQPTILAGIIRRATERAGLEKRVTAHTLRHTAATWLRQETGDARLVAAYLGHSDLSTVSRYTHVANEELHAAAAAIVTRGGLEHALSPAQPAANLARAGRSDAGTATRRRPGARAERFQSNRREAA